MRRGRWLFLLFITVWVMPKVLLRAYRLGGAFVYLLGVLFVLPHAVNWPLWLGLSLNFREK